MRIEFIEDGWIDEAGEKGERVRVKVPKGTIFEDQSPASVAYWVGEGVARALPDETITNKPEPKPAFTSPPADPLSNIPSVEQQELDLVGLVQEIRQDLDRNFMRGVYSNIRTMGTAFEDVEGLTDDDHVVLKAALDTVTRSGRFDREMRTEFAEALNNLYNAL